MFGDHWHWHTPARADHHSIISDWSPSASLASPAHTHRSKPLIGQRVSVRLLIGPSSPPAHKHSSTLWLIFVGACVIDWHHSTITSQLWHRGSTVAQASEYNHAVLKHFHQAAVQWFWLCYSWSETLVQSPINCSDADNDHNYQDIRDAFESVYLPLSPNNKSV